MPRVSCWHTVLQFTFISDVALQPIRVQTTPIMVDTAIMHIMDHTACTNELRVSAMHDVNPLHMFMFSNQGLVLNMNQAASEACRYSGETWFRSISACMHHLEQSLLHGW